jgi:hypothetical protein
VWWQCNTEKSFDCNDFFNHHPRFIFLQNFSLNFFKFNVRISRISAIWAWLFAECLQCMQDSSFHQKLNKISKTSQEKCLSKVHCLFYIFNYNRLMSSAYISTVFYVCSLVYQKKKRSHNDENTSSSDDWKFSLYNFSFAYIFVHVFSWCFMIYVRLNFFYLTLYLCGYCNHKHTRL